MGYKGWIVRVVDVVRRHVETIVVSKNLTFGNQTGMHFGSKRNLDSIRFANLRLWVPTVRNKTISIEIKQLWLAETLYYRKKKYHLLCVTFMEKTLAPYSRFCKSIISWSFHLLLGKVPQKCISIRPFFLTFAFFLSIQ